MITISYEEQKFITAYLHLKDQCVRKISQLNPFFISLNTLHNNEREDIVKFIQNVYKADFNAKIQVDYPVLMSVHDDNNRILAATGIRYAENSTLFLERYTKKPIESFLNCNRHELVEIGNLASAGRGASVFLFNALSAYLNDQKIQYAAITGTTFLHRYFDRLGLEPQVICEASGGFLNPLELHNWGSYYDTRPRVLVGSIKHSARRLETLFGARFERVNSMTTQIHLPI